jgi:uncharacterized membrane protein (UPF0127 family)
MNVNIALFLNPNKTKLAILSLFFLIFTHFKLEAKISFVPNDLSKMKKGKVIHSKTKSEIEVVLAITEDEQLKGLSEIQSTALKNNQGMLFINEQMSIRQFWMVQTLFDLDIIFIDNKYKVIGIERNAKHHPGRKEPPSIYRTKSYHSQYVLEMDAQSSIAESIQIGDDFKFNL